MAKTNQAESARLVDSKLSEWQAAARTLSARPPRGWISALRAALGMSSLAFAKRLKVAQPTAYLYERGEVAGTLTVETLRRIAEALDAELVVALVPRRPVADTLRARAEAIARDEISAVERTMQLEAQTVDGDSTREEFEALITTLLASPRKLWR